MATTDGYETVTIRSAGPGLEAELVPSANMLCCSLRHRGEELLHPGHGVAAYATRGKTMGIPLLHPWANRLAAPAYEVAGTAVVLPEPDGRFSTDPNGLPIHGALPRLMRWEVESGSAGDRIVASLDWSLSPLLELFPFVHELVLDVTVTDDRLTFVTTLRATGDDHVPVSFGYHPYLVLPGVSREQWQVELGASRRLVLDKRMIPTGAREPLPTREFTLADQSWDDGLDGLPASPRFIVSAGGRRLAMTFDAGYDYAQVYAPPGQDFICFEPMTAPTNALRSGDGLRVLAPGEEHRTAFSITTEIE
jgi:aldose 1-epimerase